MTISKDIIKCRDIHFRYDLPDTGHAEKARQLLVDVPGIEAMVIVNSNCLRVSYDIRKLTLQMLESALRDVGFSLNDSMISRIKRGVCAYCEDTHRSSLHIDEISHESPTLTVPENFTQDPRPDNWRNYV